MSSFEKIHFFRILNNKLCIIKTTSTLCNYFSLITHEALFYLLNHHTFAVMDVLCFQCWSCC